MPVNATEAIDWARDVPHKLGSHAGVEKGVDCVLALYGEVFAAQKVIEGIAPMGRRRREQVKLAGYLRVPPQATFIRGTA